MERVVYHGSSISNMKIIEKEGFDPGKIGTGWGTTYGEGIYFTPSQKYANEYSERSGYVLEVVIKYKPYLLNRDFSPTDKKHRKLLRKIRIEAIKDGYTCLVNRTGSEVVLFSVRNIVKCKLIKIHN